jgi:hypothetical protein
MRRLGASITTLRSTSLRSRSGDSLRSLWLRTDDSRIHGQRLLVPALQGWLQPRLQESLPVLLCGCHPDYRQLRLPAVDPKGSEHAHDFFECSLRFRSKRMRSFTFNVQSADHALPRRHIHNGNDDFRLSGVQRDQIAWITGNITYVDRLPLSNRSM